MRKNARDSWKESLDPAFDRPVRSYIRFLDRLAGSPGEGTLSFPEEFLKPLLRNTSWQDSEENAFSEDIFKFAKKAGLLSTADSRNIIRLINALDERNETIRVCRRLIKGLPEEESRRYYLDELKILGSGTDISEKFFYSVVFALLVRYVFVKLEGDKVEVKKASVEYFKKSNAASTLINALHLISSQLAHQQTLAGLLDRAGKGDDEALFKALTINKSLLFTDGVNGRFLRAQLSGDTEFFTKLGTAIANNPLKRIGQHAKTYSVITMFWYMGLYRLKGPELYDFLDSCGLIPPAYPYAFEKFIQRHIKPLFRD